LTREERALIKGRRALFAGKVSVFNLDAPRNV